MTRSELKAYIDAAVDEALSGIRTTNPLEAVTIFTQTLDSRLRRRVGDDLERRGRNRYTGEPHPAHPPAAQEKDIQNNQK